MQLSGGLDGGSEPPAFQRAERERILASQNACETVRNLIMLYLCQNEDDSKCINIFLYIVLLWLND